MTSSITAVRWWATAGVLAVAVGLLGAAPVAAAEPELTITLPVALVVGGVGQITIPGPATITGCPGGSVLDIEMTRLDDGGGVVGHPIAIRDGVSSDGTYALFLSRGSQIFYGPGIPSTGSIIIDAECADTGESATATAPVLPLGMSGLTGVTVLSIEEHALTPDALISGCPGSIGTQTSFSYPLSEGGADVTLPVALEPPAEANADGTLPFSFQDIKYWLDTHQPNRNGSLQIAVRCFLTADDGVPLEVAKFTVTIPPGVSLGGSEPPNPPVGRPDSAAPSAADSAAPAIDSATRASTLAATGEPTAAQSLVGLALLLLGAVTTLGSRRSRLARDHWIRWSVRASPSRPRSGSPVSPSPRS